jgi:polysaccharide deacetylase family protein (PEP-CTERM system associated)
MNILTFDVEEWFHLLDFDATRTEADWGKYEVRIHENVERVFRILEDTNTKATFFIIGWIAKTYPELVRKIADKYQIGSHTMTHQLVWQQSKKEFKEDVSASIKLLEDITGKKVECFRAPGFSIRESEAWAFETLAELGIQYDSSIFPAPASHGGMPSYGAAKPSVVETNGIQMKEFPIPYHTFAGQHIVFNGGGYFRLMPYGVIRKWTKEIVGQACNEEKGTLDEGYCLSYIHPRDLDAGQPMLEGLPAARKFKSYVGLKGAENKLRKYLKEFPFTDIATANESIDWKRVPVVKL